MTRPVVSFSAGQSVTYSSQLDLVELAPDLFLYRQKVKATLGAQVEGSTMATPLAALPNSTSSGFVDDKGRAALLKGKEPKKLELIVLTTAQLEIFRTQGWSGAEEEFYKNFPSDPWAILEADPTLTADNLARLDTSSHMLFDRHGEALPVGLVFDYIHSRISESTHDLKKLAAHLLERFDVVVYADDGRGRRQGVAKTVAEAIYDIPSYNAESGRSKSVQFLWAPSKEDYRQVWKACKGKYPSTQLREVCMEMDMLDVKECRMVKAKKPSP